MEPERISDVKETKGEEGKVADTVYYLVLCQDIRLNILGIGVVEILVALID